MTAQQIKDNTDLLIRQKTAQHSILKTDVAQQLDDIVDLVVGRVHTNSSVSGAFDLDWQNFESFDLVLVGSSSLTNNNLVNGKTIKVLITGIFALNLSAFDVVVGTYKGAETNLLAISNINGQLWLSINNETI